jgi:hypothetical protein
MDTLKLVLDYIVIPILYWAYTTYKKVLILETEVKYLNKFQTKYDVDISLVFEKLDGLKDEMHTLTSNYVLKQDCSDCRTIKK